MTRARTFKPPFTEVTCDGDVIKVRWVQRLPRFSEGYPGGGEYEDGVISLAWRGCGRAALRHVFTHEFAHYAIEREGGIPRNLKPRPTEEAAAIAAEWFSVMLRENPAVAKWLLAPLA